MEGSSLIQQMSGRRFGELVLYHVKRQSLPTTINAIQGLSSELPAAAKPLVERWIDHINPRALSESFWQQDCGDAYQSISKEAEVFLNQVGVEPSHDDLFNMFQIIVSSFAYTCHVEPGSKAFIQKALGMGKFRRLVSFFYSK